MNLIKISAAFIAVYVFFTILEKGQALIIPFVLALVVWFLINMIKGIFSSKTRLPSWICYTLSVSLILMSLFFATNIISQNVANIVKEAPKYQDRIVEISKNLSEHFKIGKEINPQEMLRGVNVGSLVSNLAMGLTTIVSKIGIIMIYVMFLFMEQATFGNKLKKLTAKEGTSKNYFEIAEKIKIDIQKYFGIKLLTSFTTACISYIIMRAVGLDFAEFWALLIFMMNFIPSIGSIIATVFPAILALIQFNEIGVFLVITIGIGTTQFLIGNLIEPKLMGDSLDMSPLVILLMLAFWGSMWGIAGMILCVPITAITLIVCDNFEATKPFVVILSSGRKA